MCGATQGIKIPSLSSWSSSPFASYHIVLVPFLCFPFQISLSKVSFAAFRPFPFPPLPLPLPSRPIPYPRGQSGLKSQPMFADLILILVFSLQIGAPESQLVLVNKCCWNDMCQLCLDRGFLIAARVDKCLLPLFLDCPEDFVPFIPPVERTRSPLLTSAVTLLVSGSSLPVHSIRLNCPP